MEESKPVTELLVITPEMKTFTANGKVYRKDKTLSPSRWADMQRLELETAFGTTMKDHAKAWMDIYKALQAKEGLADAGYIAKNMILGIASLDNNRVHTGLKMCALFINYEGEDVRSINEKQIADKVNDWNEGGIDVMSLFTLALSAIPDFLSAYTNASRLSSPQETNPIPTPTNGSSQGSTSTTVN